MEPKWWELPCLGLPLLVPPRLDSVLLGFLLWGLPWSGHRWELLSSLWASLLLGRLCWECSSLGTLLWEKMWSDCRCWGSQSSAIPWWERPCWG